MACFPFQSAIETLCLICYFVCSYKLTLNGNNKLDRGSPILILPPNVHLCFPQKDRCSTQLSRIVKLCMCSSMSHKVIEIIHVGKISYSNHHNNEWMKNVCRYDWACLWLLLKSSPIPMLQVKAFYHVSIFLLILCCKLISMNNRFREYASTTQFFKYFNHLLDF